MCYTPPIENAPAPRQLDRQHEMTAAQRQALQEQVRKDMVTMSAEEMAKVKYLLRGNGKPN